MKYFFFTLFYLFLLINLQGQSEQDNYRIIYLKDGSVLKGTLLASSPAGVRIQILNKDELFLADELIIKVIKPKSNIQFIEGGHSIKNKGRFFALHFNLLSNFRLTTSGIERGKPRINTGIHFVLGHKFSETAALGFGVGLDKYPEQMMLPLFLDFRGVYDWNKEKIAFSYNLMLGHSLHTGFITPVLNDEKRGGGIFIYPNIGMRIARKKQTNILIDMGYKFQFDKFIYERGQSRFTIRKWYNSLALRMGWEF